MQRVICQAEVHGCGDQAQRMEQKKWKEACADAWLSWEGEGSGNLGTNLGLLSSKKALQGETRNVTKLRPCCVLSTEAGSRGSGLVNRSAGKDGRGGRRSFSKYVQIPHAIY